MLHSGTPIPEIILKAAVHIYRHSDIRAYYLVGVHMSVRKIQLQHKVGKMCPPKHLLGLVFIVVKGTEPKIHHDNINSLVAFSTFTMLCNCHYYPTPEYFHHQETGWV